MNLSDIEARQKLKFINKSFHQQRFRISLHSISLNQKTNFGSFYLNLCTEFSLIHKHKSNAMRIISVSGSNDKVFTLISEKLELLGYKSIKYFGGHLFYWYDEKIFKDVSIIQQFSFLFEINFQI